MRKWMWWVWSEGGTFIYLLTITTDGGLIFRTGMRAADVPSPNTQFDLKA